MLSGYYYWDIATGGSAVTPRSGWLQFRPGGTDAGACITSGGQIYGAVWNDYAEYRQSSVSEPGRCVTE